MKTRLIALFLALSALSLPAQRNNLKPIDFEPLTSLPWADPEAKLGPVLEAIFREPNPDIRYPVLGAYLRVIPVGQLASAFDLCVVLEGTQAPDELVSFFLGIWAERDPLPCWKKARGLIRLVGIEDGPLGYDGWETRDRITAQDVEAIRASRFWLRRRALSSFPDGVERSALSGSARQRLLREFAEVWLSAFDTWPTFRGQPHTWLGNQPNGFPSEMMARFVGTAEQSRNFLAGLADPRQDAAAFQVALRRWLFLEPSQASEILKAAEAFSSEVSIELLMIWARADLPALIQWAEDPFSQKHAAIETTKGFLMSRVDAATRERWLKEAKSDKPEDDCRVILLEAWACWDPRAALDAAVATGSAEIIRATANESVYGLRRGGTWNFSHFGLGVIRDFDVAALPEELRKEVLSGWGIIIMEQWGDIDVGEAARYGFDFITRNKYESREGLIKFFSGSNEYSDDGSMTDRTFGALRVWAVVRPKEMKAWIATLKEEDMRKALTWMLEHPWGGPKQPGSWKLHKPRGSR